MLLPQSLQNLSNQISSPPAGQPVLPVAVETQVDAHLHKIFLLVELGIHKEAIGLHLVLDCQKSFSNSFCLWFWTCLGTSVCLLGKSRLWKQLTSLGFSCYQETGRFSPCMDLSMLLQDQSQLCPSSYELLTFRVLCIFFYTLYFGWNEIMIYENETCLNQLHSSWSQMAVVTW